MSCFATWNLDANVLRWLVTGLLCGWVMWGRKK